MSDVVVVVPARYAARRLPGKPLREVAGVPLIVRVVERLRALMPIPVIVATDHPGVVQAVEASGGTACMTPADCATGTDRVAAAVAGRRESLVVNVQGDQPLLDPEAVARLIQVMQADRRAVMGTLAAPIDSVAAYRSPHRVKVVLDKEGGALYFSRRPIPWGGAPAGVPPGALQHLGVYAYRRETLRALARCGPVDLERLERLEQLRALYLGIRIRTVTISSVWPSVDTEEDLQAVRVRCRRRAPG